MKNFIAFIGFLLICAGQLSGQERSLQSREISYVDTEKYLQGEIKPEFRERFKKESDKEDFKQLREFLNEKDDLLQSLTTHLSGNLLDKDFIALYDGIIAELNELKEGKSDVIEMPYEDIGSLERKLAQISLGGLRIQNAIDKYWDSDEDELKVPKKLIEEDIKRLEKEKGDISNVKKRESTLRQNIKYVKQDIYDCTKQIDSTLAPEYKEQEFRKNISVYFTILIGILLFSFFFIVYRRSDTNLSKELLSGYGLQFITLFVLIIAIILFGILSILEGSELAAILAGISGYILGKGTDNQGAVELQGRHKEPSNP